MNGIAQFENSASRRRSKHEGESSTALCDRLSRTRDISQRQLPTDQDYAVSTREYQTDQSSLKPAPTAAGPVLEKWQRQQQQQQQQKQPHRRAAVDSVTPYQSGSPIPVPFSALCKVAFSWGKSHSAAVASVYSYRRTAIVASARGRWLRPHQFLKCYKLLPSGEASRA